MHARKWHRIAVTGPSFRGSSKYFHGSNKSNGLDLLSCPDLSRRNFASIAPASRTRALDVLDAPTEPYVHTDLPGPQAVSAAQSLEQVFDIRNLNMFVDYEKSRGN